MHSHCTIWLQSITLIYSRYWRAADVHSKNDKGHNSFCTDHRFLSCSVTFSLDTVPQVQMDLKATHKKLDIKLLRRNWQSFEKDKLWPSEPSLLMFIQVMRASWKLWPWNICISHKPYSRGYTASISLFSYIAEKLPWCKASQTLNLTSLMTILEFFFFFFFRSQHQNWTKFGVRTWRSFLLYHKCQSENGFVLYFGLGNI